MGTELLETSGSPQEGVVHFLKNQHFRRRFKHQISFMYNPYKSNHFNRTFIAEINYTYQITDFIVNVSVLN